MGAQVERERTTGGTGEVRSVYVCSRTETRRKKPKGNQGTFNAVETSKISVVVSQQPQGRNMVGKVRVHQRTAKTIQETGANQTWQVAGRVEGKFIG